MGSYVSELHLPYIQTCVLVHISVRLGFYFLYLIYDDDNKFKAKIIYSCIHSLVSERTINLNKNYIWKQRLHSSNLKLKSTCQVNSNKNPQYIPQSIFNF